MKSLADRLPDLPVWLPENARLYLRHIEEGLSIRALARHEGCHASTVMRKVRKFENRRDDPLVDEALAHLGALHSTLKPSLSDSEEHPVMTAPIRTSNLIADEATIEQEARRILRRLCEIGAVLAIAPDMDKAVVLKGTVRTAVMDRVVAQAFALKDWIAITRQSRVTTYEITQAGRAALKRLLSVDEGRRAARKPDGDQGAQGAQGFAEAQSPFAEQHRIWEERDVSERGEGPRRVRYNLAESPLAALARRKDKDGKPFLEPDLVAVGERLREDFELAQMGPRVAQNWDRFLTGGDRGGFYADTGTGEGPRLARDRVAMALRDLGPGLGDMVLRCCCFLEGLEVAEKRLGWSARSGKIVLRIALMRLKRHYEEVYGGARPLIG